MNNTLKAVLLISDLTQAFLDVLKLYRETVETARSEGRDVTDEELNRLRVIRTQGLKALQQAVIDHG